jgi:hypothetical protein
MKSSTLESGHSFEWQTDGAVLRTTAKDQYLLGVINVANGQGGNIANITNASIQIEKGTSKSSYAPYFTPIELCKIGDYQDYIYKSGDNWYVHKETGFLTLDTSKIQSAYGLKYRYAKSDIPNCDIPINSSNFLCKYFTVVGHSSGAIGTVYAGGSMINFSYDQDGSDLDGFKTWAGSVGLSLYYVLANPTDTQITNSALIGQLNALYNMLPEGVADVVVTGDLPGSLTIKYYQQGTGTYTAPIVGGAEIDGGDNEQVVELDSYLPYRLVYDTNGYWRVLNKGPKVTTGAIADGSITTAKLDDGAVATNKLANGSVSNSKIANGAVNVAKIEDGAVSTAKLANGAVSNSKIATAGVKSSNIDWTTISSSGKIELGSICIQWGRNNLSSLAWFDYWSSWRRTDAKTLSFPVAFSGAPYYTSVSTNDNGTVFAQTQSNNAEHLTFYLYKPNNVPPDPTTMKVSWIAIGPKS